MKTAVLYSSTVKLSNAHRPVNSGHQPPLYVRMETTYQDIDAALANAKPQPGETVLNTVPLEPEAEKRAA